MDLFSHRSARFSNCSFMDFLLFTRFLLPWASFRAACVLSRPNRQTYVAGRLSIVNHMFRLTCLQPPNPVAPRNVCLATTIQTFVNETAAGEIPRDQPLIKMPLSVCAMVLLFKHTKKVHFPSRFFFPPSCPSRSGDDECLYRNCV